MKALGPRLRSTRLARGAAVAGTTAASTAITGSTNLIVPLAVQAYGTLNDLGAYALVSIPQTVGLAITRGLTTQTLLRGWGFRSSKGLTKYLTGVTIGAVALTLSIVVLAGLPHEYLLLAGACPIAIWQDALRQRSFGGLRPGTALFSDSMWLAALIVQIGAFAIFVDIDVPTVLVAYLTSGSAALAVLAMTKGSDSRAGEPKVPLGSVTIETTVLLGLAQIPALVVGNAISLTLLGILRSAQILLSGASMLANLATTLLVPRLDRVRIAAVGTASACASLALSALVLATVVLLPTSLIEGHLGFTIDRTLVATYSVGAVGFAASSALGLVLVHIRETTPRGSWLTARLLAGILEPPITVSLAVVFGAPGIAASALVSTALFLYAFRIFRGRAVGRCRLDVHDHKT